MTMQNVPNRRSTRHPSSHESVRPLRTAIGALGLGCALLLTLAFLHEDLPYARLVAERAADQATEFPSHPKRDSQTTIVDEPGDTTANSVTQSGQDATSFWNASQSGSQGDRGPKIQIGPLVIGKDDPFNAGSDPQASQPAGNPPALVMRTYRPTSISAASLERLIRPLLTSHGGIAATTSGTPLPRESVSASSSSHDATDSQGPDPSGVLVVSDRPEAIHRIDALCHDLESLAPRIAVDVMVINVSLDAGQHLPVDQWRNDFGSVQADLLSVVNQIRGTGRVTLRANSQLQTISGTWAELELSERNLTSATTTSATTAEPAGSTVTTLRVRPTAQPEGVIRLELLAHSSRPEEHVHGERRQQVTVRFNTEILLREGATGIVNLFVDDLSTAGSGPATSFDRGAAASVIPRSLSALAARIAPQPSPREHTLLLLMPRIAHPRQPGKIAGAQPHTPV
jgi:hypothetical protein